MTRDKTTHYMDEESRFTGKYRSELFKTLHWSYQPFLGKIFFYLGFGFLGRALLLANTNVIGHWVDSFCEGSKCRALPGVIQHFSTQEYLTTLVVMCFLGFFSTLLFRVGFSRLSAEAVSRLYDEVTLRTSRFPISFFDRTPAGRVVTRFSSDYGNVFRLFGGPLAEFISILFELVIMVVLVTAANKIYFSLVILIGLTNYLIYRRNRGSLRIERRELSYSRSPSIAHFAETAQGASTIRTYLRQNVFIKRFQYLNNYYLDQKLRTVRKLTLFSFSMNSSTAFLFFVTGVSSYFLLQKGLVSVGSIGVAFTFVSLAGTTLQMFFEWLTQFEEAMVGVERLDQYLHRELEAGAQLPFSASFPTHHRKYDFAQEASLKNQDSTVETAATIHIEGLTFRYGKDMPLVLKDVSLEIQKGERLGIVGKTGSGKSSLIQSLFYLYPFQAGKISINDLEPELFLTKDTSSGKKIDLEIYRKKMAMISQDPSLFKASLRDNLTLDQHHTDQELLFVLEKVGLKSWFDNLPYGLKSPIEERGKNLSAGEKQLLCMARCLLQKAQVIIMDEATSSVDPQSEEIMVQATEKIFAGRTQIIVAHRLSTLEKCDRILWLDQGRIHMIGLASEILSVFKEIHPDEVRL